MKMQPITFLVIALVLIAGCKKEKDTLTLVKSIEQSGSKTTYEYNEDGKVVKSTSTDGDVATYSYATNRIEVAYINGPNTSGANNNAIYTLRSDGKVDLFTGDVTGTTFYTYNSAGEVQKSTSVWDTTVFEWSNGNIIKETISSPGGVTVFTYTHFLDKLNSVSSKNLGATWSFSSKNLVKTRTVSYSGSEDVFEYTYELDSENRVVSRTYVVNGLPVSGINTTTYTYY